MRALKIIVFILLVTLLCAFLLLGCKSTKDKTQNKTDRELIESSKTSTIRKGDTVTYVVPNVILKDTVITTTNRVTGTTQILRYNEEGKLTAAECISGFIEIIEENQRQLIEAIDQSTKHKENEISPSVILYAFVGLALLIVIVLGFILWQFKKQAGLVNGVINRFT
jgi:hypothetical protein